MLTLYVSIVFLDIFIVTHYPYALSLINGCLPPALGCNIGLQVSPSLRGRTRGDNFRFALLGAKHLIHVDYLGGPIQRQRQLFLLPDRNLRPLPHHHVYLAVWGG